MINLTRLWTGHAQPADHLRYGRGHGSARHAADRRPVVVWNITRTCNLKCIHCYSDSDAQRYPGELDWDQMVGVVEDLAAYGVPGLLLSGGEPTVHPRFDDLVDLASGLGMRLTISTNGTRLTADRATRLKEAGVAYVGISLDGIGEIHDHFRGRVGAFADAVKGFRHCQAAGQKTGLRLTLTRHNAENLDAILDFIEEEDIRRACFYHLVPAGRGSDLQLLDADASRHAIDTLLQRIESWDSHGDHREILTVTQPADGPYLLLRMEESGNPHLDEARQLLGWNGGGAHSSGRGIANIDPQGNVHPDQFWQDVTLGNVKQTRFSHLWEGQAGDSGTLEDIRSLAGLTPDDRRARMRGRCAGCRFFSICGGGFRTRAAFATGDIWGSDPACYLREEEIADMAAS